MFEATIAGSLPKPSWLAETHKLWPQWKAQGAELAEAKRDATLVWIKAQEDAGLDIVTDGEQSRQHFVHGFLEAVEGIDFEHKVEMGIRNDRYKAMVPQVVGPLKLKGLDVVQFDEPAFNVYMKDVNVWGLEALERAAAGLTCTTAVHICYGYGIKANIDWKKSLADGPDPAARGQGRDGRRHRRRLR